MDQTSDILDELSDALMRAFRRLRRNERGELSPFGLTFGQARALRMLAVATEGMRIGELAVMLEIVPRSATTMVDGLEAAGLVSRRPDPTDRRSVLVGASVEGRALVSRLAGQRRAGAESLFAPLSVAEKEELLRLLRAATEERS